ncbi:MAG: hypothetical protein ACAH95_00025 [Fimbriimonas sp.]
MNDAIKIYNIETRETSTVSNRFGYQGSFHPNGRLFVFGTSDTHDVVLLDIENGNSTVLGKGWTPHFSLNGEEIACARPGTNEVVFMSPFGSVLRTTKVNDLYMLYGYGPSSKSLYVRLDGFERAGILDLVTGSVKELAFPVQDMMMPRDQ